MRRKTGKRRGWAWVASGMALACSMAGAQAQDAAGQGWRSGPWADKALLVERKGLTGRWEPWKSQPLGPAAERMQASGSKEDGGVEPEFAVWSQGARRRIEIWCGKSMLAWDGLRVGEGAQLEFECEGGKYRAQAGRMAQGGDAGAAGGSAEESMGTVGKIER